LVFVSRVRTGGAFSAAGGAGASPAAERIDAGPLALWSAGEAPAPSAAEEDPLGLAEG